MHAPAPAHLINVKYTKFWILQIYHTLFSRYMCIILNFFTS